MAGLFDDIPSGTAGRIGVSPPARDLLIRTVIGEAANQPDEGQAAVAHVVMNRVKAGRYGGKDIPGVVLAKNQFEPWSTRAKELWAIPPDSPAYQRAAAIVDGVLTGQAPDPTGGATHFLEPDIVRQRRGGTLPAWASGEGQRIGSHLFFAPEGRVGEEKPKSLVDKLAQTWPARLAKSAMGAATLPGDVYQGRVTSNDPEYYSRATDLAGFVMGGGMPAAERGAVGVAGGRALSPRPLPMDDASRFSRADAMGFRRDMDTYHGTGAALDEFRAVPTNSDGFRTPGVSVSRSPEIANEYSAARGNEKANPQVLRLWHRTDRPGVIALKGDETHPQVVETLRRAFDSGFDAVMLKNYTSPAGKSGDIIIVKNANQLRVPQAAFDPAKRDSAFLLGSGQTRQSGIAAIPAASDQPKAAAAGLFDDLEAAPGGPDPGGGSFAPAPEGGGNFRTAREGISEPARAVGTMEAIGRGAAQGVTANFYDELRALGEAGGLKPDEPLSIQAIIAGAYRRATGDEAAAARYDRAAARERAAQRQAETERPVSSFVGNVAGAVALPVGGALSAATLPGRLVQGAKVGAAYGAAAGAGEGEDLTDRASRALSGGAMGGAVGAGAPVALAGIEAAGRGVAAAGRPLVNTLRGLRDPEAEASRRVAGAIERDLRSGAVPMGQPGEMVGRMRAGEPVGVVDMGGETTRALARSAANTSPEGRAALDRVVQGRYEGQTARAEGLVSRIMGGPPDALGTQDALRRAAAAANRPAYAKAYQDGSTGLWDEGFEQIAQAPVVQDAIKAATRTGANRAAAEGFTPVRNPFEFDETGRMLLRINQDGSRMTPSLQFWDHVKRNLDDTITKLQRAGENSAARDAVDLRTAMVRRLDELVPSYREARQGAAGFFGAEDALDAGRKFVASTAENAEARRALAKMTPQERELFANGFASDLVSRIRESRDGRNILLQIGQSPAARERIDLALGPQRAREIETFLRIEGIMDDARRAVGGNSTTARQLAEMGLAGGAYGATTGDFSPQGLLTGALIYGAGRKGVQKIDDRVARRVAEMLASNDPNVLRKGIAIVARQKGYLESLRAADAAMARVGSGQAGVLQLPMPSRAEEDQ